MKSPSSVASPVLLGHPSPPVPIPVIPGPPASPSELNHRLLPTARIEPVADIKVASSPPSPSPVVIPSLAPSSFFKERFFLLNGSPELVGMVLLVHSPPYGRTRHRHVVVADVRNWPRNNRDVNLRILYLQLSFQDLLDMQGRKIRTCAQKTRFLFFLFTRRSFVGFRSVFVVPFPALLRLGVDGVNIFQESASRIGLSNLQAK